VQVVLKEIVTEYIETLRVVQDSTLRAFYMNKIALLLLSKLLLPEMIFGIFLLDPNAWDFARFFSLCSFKQKHYIITHLLACSINSDWLGALLY
jgi:hypothetical protein